MGTAVLPGAINGDVEVDTRSEFKKEQDGLIGAMVDGRIATVVMLNDLLLDIAHERQKTFGQLLNGLRRRIRRRLKKANLSDEQVRVIAPELRQYLGLES